MTAISITAANVLKGPNAKTNTGVAGEAITRGMPVYLKPSDGRLYKADANLSLEASIAIGMAYGDVAAGQDLVYITEDDQYTPGGTVVKGTIYVVGATAGDVAPAADIVSGWFTNVLFVAYSATQAVLKFGVRSPAAT